MIPELGSFAIILALAFALTQTLVVLWGGLIQRRPYYLSLSVVAVTGQFIFLCFAMLCLITCFLTNDLTVIYVREHSHRLLPLLFRIGAAWGGHEGSLLLWCLILSGWSFVFVLFSLLTRDSYAKDFMTSDPKTFVNLFHKVIMVLGVISSGFLTFILFTSNPFKRDFPTELIAGNDLTPVLQDPGLIFHPPMLYLGYVGFAIAFAFAIAILIEGKLTRATAAYLRPWVVLPWSFLSCGIVLGSWWAYRELGWGGWWFWDPVENASLLPWLSATALLHSLIVCQKRHVFQGWIILLAIVTFALSLLGTFLVRSGILVSVHAFASDPTRGIFLLLYLAFIIGGALVLYTTRIKLFFQAPQFKLLSRETFLLINSVFLLTAVATIVLGTLYPIILDAMQYGKISVGEPYFNTVFLPLMLPLLLLMGIAPHVHWGNQPAMRLWHKIRFSLLLSILLGFALPSLFHYAFHFLTAIGLTLGLWIIIATLQYALQVQQPWALRHWAMIVAHAGIAVIVIGITLNKSYSQERQVKMAPTETVSLAGYDFSFIQLTSEKGANFESETAHFAIFKHQQLIDTVTAEQRVYLAHQESFSKTGILVNPWRDLYLALGSPLDKGAWSVRIYVEPFVRWIWFGGFMLLMGGLLSLIAYLQTRGRYDE